jgi:hypothetical protein
VAWLAYADPRNYSPGDWADGSVLQAGFAGAANERNYQPGDWASGASVTWSTVSPEPLAEEALGSALIPWALSEEVPTFDFRRDETVTADDSGSWAEQRRSTWAMGGRQTTDGTRRQVTFRNVVGGYTTLLNQSGSGPVSSIRSKNGVLYACGANIISTSSYSLGYILVSNSLGKTWNQVYSTPTGTYGIRDAMLRDDGKFWFIASHGSSGTGCFEFDPGTGLVTLLKATGSSTDVAGYMSWTDDDNVWFYDAGAWTHRWNGSTWTTSRANDWGSGSETPFVHTWGGTDVLVGADGNYGSHLRRWGGGDTWWFWPNNPTYVGGDQPPRLNTTYWGQVAGPSIDDFYLAYATGSNEWYGIEWRDRIAHWNGSVWTVVWDVARGTGGQSWPIIRRDPDTDEYIAIFYNRLVHSADGGAHWSSISGPSVPNVVHSFTPSEAPPSFYAEENETVTAEETTFSDGPRGYERRWDEAADVADTTQRSIGYHFISNETVTAVDALRSREVEYCDYFDDGVPLRTLSGNGSVTETGDQLVLTINAGVNSDWWTFGRNGILAYEPIPHIEDASWIYYETTLTSLTNPDPSYSHAMWGLRANDGNFVYFGFSGSSLWVGGTTGYAGWWSGGSTSITLPARVRIVWQTSNGHLYFDWHNGTDWQRVYTLTSYTLQYQQVFFYNKNWSYFPQIVSYWDYLCVWPISTTLDLERLNVLDAIEFPSSSVGGSFWQVPEIPEGILAVDHRVGSRDLIEQPTSSVEDSLWTAPEVPQGLRSLLGTGLPDDFFWTLGTAQYKADSKSLDGEGHPHFTTYRPYLLYAGDTSREAWDNPTTTNFTGYARNGTRYTNGVQDAGPVYAPWYSEAAGTDRSSVGPFPQKYLIAVTRLEVVIFDLATYPATLNVWMRFRRGETTASSYTLFGRQAESLADIQMVNGVIIATTLENGTDRGRLHLIDFKQNTQRFANLIGPDNHWMGVSGRNITNRNAGDNWTTSGVSPSLRINPEYPYSVSVYSLPDGSKYWVAVGGEDQGPDVFEVDASGVPQLRYAASGETGGDNLGNVRQVLFDRDGWFWHSYYGRLYRNGVGYQHDGTIPIPESDTDFRYPFVDLETTIWDLVDSENFIYAATDHGVYRIQRGTLETRLMWTIAGGGGVGLSGIPGAGEILVGTKPMVAQLRAYSLDGSGYIAVATKLDGGNLHGGVTLIKTRDDSVLDSKLYPELAEDGSYVSIPVGL